MYKRLSLASLLALNIFTSSPAAALKDNNKFFLHYNDAIKAEKQTNYAAAIKNFNLALNVKPNDFQTLIKLGLIHQNSPSGDKNQNLTTALEYFKKAAKYRSSDPLPYLLSSRIFQDLNDNKKAIEMLKKATNLDTENILLKEGLAELYFQEKDFKSAIEIFNKVILAYPQNLKARSHLAASLQSTDNYIAAIEQYNYVLNYQPDNYSVLKNLGDSWLALKQLDKAKQAYQDAKNAHPNVPNTYADLAYISIHEKDFDTAIENYEKALGLKEKFIWKKQLAFSLWKNKDLQKAADLFSEVKENAISAYLYQSLGQLDKAKENYLTAIEANPKDVRSIFNLAKIYHKQGEYENARDTYQEVLAQRPKDVEVKFLLAALEQESGDVDKAIKVYDEILADYESEDKAEEIIAKDDLIKEKVHYNLGLAYQDQNNLEQAEDNFEAILAEQPLNASKFQKTKDVYKRLSFIKIVLDKDTEAEKLINDWLREDPASVDARNFYADFLVHVANNRKAIEQLRLASVLDRTVNTRLKLANLLHSQNNLYEALAEYQTILQSEPENIDALIGAANNFQSLGFVGEAEDTYDKALAKYPDDLMLNFNYGLLLQNHGKLKDALAKYNKVLELNTNFTKAHYTIGLCHWDMGNKDEAKIHFDIFLADSNDDKLKAEITKIIDDAKKPEIPNPGQLEDQIMESQIEEIT